MKKLNEEGPVKSIGMSKSNKRLIRKIITYGSRMPLVMKVEVNLEESALNAYEDTN